jgi:hypothetical protein
MKKKVYRAVIIGGPYIGLTGWATQMNDYGKVIFYPEEDNKFYRIYVQAFDIQYLE